MRVALQGVASRDAEKLFFFWFLQATLTSAADSAWVTATALVSVTVHFINAQQAN